MSDKTMIMLALCPALFLSLGYKLGSDISIFNIKYGTRNQATVCMHHEKTLLECYNVFKWGDVGEMPVALRLGGGQLLVDIDSLHPISRASK